MGTRIAAGCILCFCFANDPARMELHCSFAAGLLFKLQPITAIGAAATAAIGSTCRASSNDNKKMRPRKTRTQGRYYFWRLSHLSHLHFK